MGHPFVSVKSVKRVRLVRRADGYYCQFGVDIECLDIQPPTGQEIGLDIGLESFYTDSNGHQEPNPKFLRKAESEIKHAQHCIYKKVKGSSGRRKARARYARIHLRVNRQRNEHAKRLARKSCKSNRKLPPQECTQCKRVVKKVLSTRTHVCSCGCVLHRDWNAAINIWLKAKSRACPSRSNASGVGTSTLLGETLVEQVLTVKLESHALDCRGSVKTSSYNS